MANALALTLLQLITLGIPPVAIIGRHLWFAENLSWRMRQFGFVLATSSITFFLIAEGIVLYYVIRSLEVPTELRYGSIIIILGLVPFAVFLSVVYREAERKFA